MTQHRKVAIVKMF